MPIVEHLRELRRRLFIAIIAIAVAGGVAFALYPQILDVLIRPYCDIRAQQGQSCQLLVTDPLEGFSTRLKVAGYGGLFLASPVVFWELWRFVAPGLYANEKRYAIPFLIASVVLFSLGGLLAYLTLPKALAFLVQVGGPNLNAFFRPSTYLSLIIFMIVAFGFAFEFPVFLVFLQLAGVIESQSLRRWRRPAVVAIVVAAAVITPSQDPYTLLAMSVPMYLFYEASIAIGRLLKK